MTCLFIALIFFFLLFLCCHVVESETVRATEEQRQVMINVKKKIAKV